MYFDKPKASAVALLILGVTTTLGCWSLGIVDDPYRSQTSSTPTPGYLAANWVSHATSGSGPVPIGAWDCGVGFRMQVLL